MSLSVLAFLIIAITLPLSYALVKGISFAYEAKDAKIHALDKAARKANN
ncbi:hypothetical protein [Acetilactobacillus jinshanensis]|nr:hypothetical protein [Acetilactobacillus jinshanensis]URL61249.1 hypothetical protein HGK75_04440 [uncultured bacterium]